MASLLSTNNSDIAPLEDFDEEDIEGNLLFFGVFCIYRYIYLCFLFLCFSRFFIQTRYEQCIIYD